MPAPSVDAATALAQRRRPHVAARDTRLRNFAADVRALEESLGVDRTVESSTDSEPEDFNDVNRRDGRSGDALGVFMGPLTESNQEFELHLQAAFQDASIRIGAPLEGCMQGWAISDPHRVLSLQDRKLFRGLWDEAEEAAGTTSESAFNAFKRLFSERNLHKTMARIAGFTDSEVLTPRQDAMMLHCFDVFTALPGGENAVFESLFYATKPFIYSATRESHCLTATRRMLHLYQRATTVQQCVCKLASLDLGFHEEEVRAGRATGDLDLGPRALAAGASATTPRPMEESDDDDDEALETATLDTVQAALGDSRQRDRLKARLQAMLDSDDDSL